MNRDGVCYLISEPEAHGVFDTVTETERKVYCTERSVGMRESYEAQSVGIQPDLILRLPHYYEYHDEKRVKYRDRLYKVIRTWSGDNEHIDLTLNRMEGNAENVPTVSGSTESD